ncbi:hypothetical protein PV08_06979 [Exophiala spinifera]|uniref:Uncharacterized protein n=1 Tax=Exophiala spinifera TaxID=91928 RepID=A0A0D2B5J6_9EURO|nr:uncharacterized protein PV08_06979 [Exophiala spinifera]KIW14198.1 hypothetical protein PV08_06979 [Exophiala spinifera]
MPRLAARSEPDSDKPWSPPPYLQDASYAQLSDVLQLKEYNRIRDAAKNAPKVIRGYTLVFEMPKASHWDSLSPEQKFKEKRGKYGDLCFVFEEDPVSVRNRIGRIRVGKGHYYTSFEAWDAENFEVQFYATMNLLEHGLGMELGDFLKLHESLGQSVAHEYSLEDKVENTVSGQPKKRKADSGLEPAERRTKARIEEQRECTPEGHIEDSEVLDRQQIHPDHIADLPDLVCQQHRQVHVVTPPALVSQQSPQLHSKTPQVLVKQPPMLPLASQEHPPAKPFTTILRTPFGARLQREAALPPDSEVLRRRKKMCAVYGQGLMDAHQLDQRHIENFNRRMHHVVRSVYSLSQQRCDRDGNKYDASKLAMYLCEQLNLDLDRLPIYAERKAKIAHDWTNIYIIFITEAIISFHQQLAQQGRPLETRQRARTEAVNDLSERASKPFLSALQSLATKVMANEVF